jgi:hypothetical protein
MGDVLMTRFIIFALLGCLLTSCAHRIYEGDKKPANEIADISGMWGWNPINGFLGTKVCAVDGKPLKPCKTDIELLPGEHTLLMKLTDALLPEGESSVTKVFSAGENCVIGIRFNFNDDSRNPVLMCE